MDGGEVTDIEMKILAIKYNRLIEDPFPEYSDHESEIAMLRKITKHRFFSFFKQPEVPNPHQISIHAAYQMGYEKAYKEVIEGLK